MFLILCTLIISLIFPVLDCMDEEDDKEGWIFPTLDWVEEDDDSLIFPTLPTLTSSQDAINITDEIQKKEIIDVSLPLPIPTDDKKETESLPVAPLIKSASQSTDIFTKAIKHRKVKFN